MMLHRQSTTGFIIRSLHDYHARSPFMLYKTRSNKIGEKNEEEGEEKKVIR